MSKSLTLNVNPFMQNTNPMAVPSGSTAEPDNNVKYVPQTLTEEQQAQARQNIGAISASEVPAFEQKQADWNQSDDTEVDYIKNKPTIPAAPVQSDWNESDTASLAYIQNKPAIPEKEIPEDILRNWTIYSDRNTTFTYQGNGACAGAYVNGVWNPINDNRQISLEKGKNVIVCTAGGGENQFGEMSSKDGNYVIVSPSNHTGQSLNGTYTGSIVHLEGVNMFPSSDIYYFWHKRETMSDYSKLFYYVLNNLLDRNTYGDPVGNLVYVDQPFGTGSQDKEELPNITNLVAIYVPRNRKAEYIAAVESIYAPGVDISPWTAKIVEYDFLTWIDDHTPRMITLPTVPLTMTDENSTVITGDFVAQNVTITPAV